MIEIVCTNGFTCLYRWVNSSVQMVLLVTGSGFTRYWKRVTHYWKRFYSLLETVLPVSHNGFTGFPQRFYSFPTTDLLMFRNGFTHVPQRFYPFLERVKSASS